MIRTGKGKGKDILMLAMQAYRRNRGIAPQFRNSGRIGRWVVRFTLLLLHTEHSLCTMPT